MAAAETIEDRIGASYEQMSSKLRTAADYVAEHPVDVATRSLRSIATTSGVSPATFSRLARVLGFQDYEEMREAGRYAVGQRLTPFSEKVHDIQNRSRAFSTGEFLHQEIQNCLANIAYLDQDISAQKLEAIVDVLHRAGRVLLVGAKGSAGIVDHMAYQASWFQADWRLAGRNGGSSATTLGSMKAGDAVFALTKTPYVRATLKTLDVAKELGLTTVVVTDSHSSPAIQFADHWIVIPTESANFFSSYVATLVVIETIMGLLVAKAGPEAEARIRATEERTRRLGENWRD